VHVPTPLLPDRHPVRDFFVLDPIDVVPRDDMASMEHPIFSLASQGDRRTVSYEHNGVRLEIIPSALGLPTVLDKDILIYCISHLIQRIDDGEPVGPKVRIRTHDLLVQTNRPTNNLSYERLLPALNRLRGVVINTTIATGKRVTTHGFGLIDEFTYNRRGSMHAKRLEYLEIKLSDWLFRAIGATEVLPISRDYFRLRSSLDRRIYELARKHCGKQTSWRIGFDTLQKKCGSRQAMKHFSAHLRAMVRSNHLPDYALTLEDGQAVFHRRLIGANKPRKSVIASTADAPRAETANSTKRLIRVSQDAMDALYEIAPGFDRYWLESTYQNWAADKEVARSEDARFLAWARSFTKGRRP
jgi:plasmid replication initiation protein